MNKKAKNCKNTFLGSSALSEWELEVDQPSCDCYCAKGLAAGCRKAKTQEARLVEREAGFILKCQHSGKTVDSLWQRLPSFSSYHQSFIDMQGGPEQRKEKLDRQLQEKVLSRGWSVPGSGFNPTDAKTSPKLPGQVCTLVWSKQNHWKCYV